MYNTYIYIYLCNKYLIESVSDAKSDRKNKAI